MFGKNTDLEENVDDFELEDEFWRKDGHLSKNPRRLSKMASTNYCRSLLVLCPYLDSPSVGDASEFKLNSQGLKPGCLECCWSRQRRIFGFAGTQGPEDCE
ncbi:hypothetical protein Droror1_Dr00028190 [Drosera rotundifolia]